MKKSKKNHILNGFVLLVFALLIFAFFYFGAHKYLTFQALKENNQVLKTWSAENVWLSAGLFFVIYVVCTALSLPGAAILTLASGVIFGLGLGTLLSSFASTLGAGLAFLGARYFLKDWVQSKFGSKISSINAGVEKEGAFYLFTLRLMPVFPFFLVNLLMGLTPIKFWTYFFVSQAAMLPGTLIYVNAGTRLAEITSTKDILSPSLIMSFVLLGAFPLIVKKALSTFATNK